jgi:hypothetical protein
MQNSEQVDRLIKKLTNQLAPHIKTFCELQHQGDCLENKSGMMKILKKQHKVRDEIVHQLISFQL